MHPTTDRPIVFLADEVRSLAPASSLWAACAVPGTGPEYRFTGAAGGPLHRLVTAIRVRRAHRRAMRAVRSAYRDLEARARVIGGRSC